MSKLISMVSKLAGWAALLTGIGAVAGLVSLLIGIPLVFYRAFIFMKLYEWFLFPVIGFLPGYLAFVGVLLVCSLMIPAFPAYKEHKEDYLVMWSGLLTRPLVLLFIGYIIKVLFL